MEFLKKLIRKYMPKMLLKVIKGLYEKYRYIKIHSKFIGNDVYCPCCGKYFSNFKMFQYDKNNQSLGMYKKHNLEVVCPYCNSYPRHRIVCDYLEKSKLLSTSKKILIFAPPTGYAIWLKRNKIRYISADLFDRAADKKVDIQNIPFKDNEFDFISCDHVLEHVPDYMLALKELFRVVRVNGYVEVTVPLLPDMSTTYEDKTIIDPIERAVSFGQHDHLRIFGIDFMEKLKDVGFSVTIQDGDTCDKNIVPLTAPAVYDYNKIFILKKHNSGI